MQHGRREGVRKLRHWKQRYDEKAKFVWRRSITWNGVQVTVGDPIPDDLAASRTKLRRFWESSTIELAEFEAKDVLNPETKEGGKRLRADGTEKGDGQTPTPQPAGEAVKPESLVSGAQRKWAVKGLDKEFKSKGEATKAAAEMLEKQAADAAAKELAEKAEADAKAAEDASKAEQPQQEVAPVDPPVEQPPAPVEGLVPAEGNQSVVDPLES